MLVAGSLHSYQEGSWKKTDNCVNDVCSLSVSCDSRLVPTLSIVFLSLIHRPEGLWAALHTHFGCVYVTNLSMPIVIVHLLHSWLAVSACLCIFPSWGSIASSSFVFLETASKHLLCQLTMIRTESTCCSTLLG